MQTLRQGEKGRAYPRLNRLIVGRFDGDPSAEVVSYAVHSDHLWRPV